MSTAFPRGSTAQGAALAVAWSRLAWRTGEMMLAASEVIAVRSAQLVAAGATPSARDNAERTRMVAEKWEASVESGSAVATTSFDQALRGASRWWSDALRLQLQLASLATSSSPAQAQARWARAVGTAGPLVNRSMLDAVARSSAALGPVHRRTAANVRRLRRQKR